MHCSKQYLYFYISSEFLSLKNVCIARMVEYIDKNFGIFVSALTIAVDKRISCEPGLASARESSRRIATDSIASTFSTWACGCVTFVDIWIKKCIQKLSKNVLRFIRIIIGIYIQIFIKDSHFAYRDIQLKFSSGCKSIPQRKHKRPQFLRYDRMHVFHNWPLSMDLH